MAVQWSEAERKQAALTYLQDIHNALSVQARLNLHTFFYFDNFDKCPICDYELFQQSDATT